MSPLPGRRDLVATLAKARGDLCRSRCEIEDLRRHNEVLREVAEPLIHLVAAGERFAFIHARRERFSVKLMCRVLIADRSNYHGWVRALDRRRDREHTDQQVVDLILEVHRAYPAYGVPRVTRELKRQGIAVGWRVVTRLMRADGSTGTTRRKGRNLTRTDSRAAMVPDLIRRDFSAPMPGLKATGEISCFAAEEGWVYLATVIDLCSGELVGYAIAPPMRAGLAVDAITAAHRNGLPAGNAIMHADCGSRYHAKIYRSTLQRLDIGQSAGRTGSCLDGAGAGSFFATIKAEIGTDSWPDRTSARRDIENWITAYNQRRLHSTLGYRTPAETRTAWQQRISRAA